MVYVIKATGEKEPFSEEKIIGSIKRAKIPSDLHSQVISHVKSKLYNNIHTSEIYKHILEFLKKAPQPYIETKYRLKQAIMDLGPTGYPFEDFMSKILQVDGFTTKTRTIIDGKCIKHEIDIIAEKNHASNTQRIMVEAKFHNLAGTKTDVQAALYTKARFDDVKEKNNLTEAWLVTNTNATIDAIAYGNCAGMKIVSWDYPENGSIRDRIENHKLFPITVLTTLSKEKKQKLLERGVVMCQQLVKAELLLNELYFTEELKNSVFAEIESIQKL